MARKGIAGGKLLLETGARKGIAAGVLFEETLESSWSVIDVDLDESIYDGQTGVVVTISGTVSDAGKRYGLARVPIWLSNLLHHKLRQLSQSPWTMTAY